MIGINVYIKFGTYHGTKAQVVGVTEKNGEPAFLLRTEDGTVITKRQKNTVKMLPANK